MYRIFIGYDSREDVSYRVCKHSIERNCNEKIDILPVKQNELREQKIYTREIDKFASTEFSLTRFLVPHLSKFEGFSLFVDCDFLFQNDINKLLDSIDKSKAVSVVKHNYNPENLTKMDGKIQHVYPRKNWSSFIVFNNEHSSNKILTPDLVNNQTPQYLHRFSWLDDSEIGEISHTWNYLVGWYDDIERPNAIHYTEGGPWFSEYKDCDFSKEWLYEYYLMKESVL